MLMIYQNIWLELSPLLMALNLCWCDDVKKVLEKLDNMFTVFILHSLPKEYATVKDQALTNTTIPTVEEIIDRLTQVSSPSDDT